tara:strand:- start:545 stop:1672 length:1128 start_codon:yes stop_codon:yes gene_type:complete
MYKSKTMSVYWGYANSGKLHIGLHAKYNGMTVLSSKYKNFMKTKTIVHNRGITPKGNYWIFHDLQKKLYGRNKNKFMSSETTRTNHIKTLHFVPSDSYINTLSKAYDDFMLGLQRSNFRAITFDEMEIFTDEDVKKFTSDDYKGCDLYNHAMMQSMVNKEFEELGYKMLNDNADEIFDDVDLLMSMTITHFNLSNSSNPNNYGNEDGTCFCENNYLLQKNEKNKKNSIPENVLNKLRKANNVIPYKSDVFSWALSFIDSFSHLTHHIYDEGQEILTKELYDKNKKIIFQYLDHQFYIPIKIAEFLTKRNIPYRYFDLDNDSYKEVFGGNFELDRNYTSHSECWKNYQDRYNQIEDMVKEYITERNLPSHYIPNKL